jgi:hypothetical protein
MKSTQQQASAVYAEVSLVGSQYCVFGFDGRSGEQHSTYVQSQEQAHRIAQKWAALGLPRKRVEAYYLDGDALCLLVQHVETENYAKQVYVEFDCDTNALSLVVVDAGRTFSLAA